MLKRPLILLALLFCVIAPLAGGCATDPLVRREQLETVYGATLTAVSAAVDAGAIKKNSPTARTINAARIEADKALNDLDALTLSNGRVTIDFYVDRAASAVARFAAVWAQSKGSS